MTADTEAGRPTLDKAIGARIRMIRKMRAMSQPELAAAIGLSFQQVQRYETGESSLSVALMSRIACALGVSPAHLLEAFLHDPVNTEPGLDALQTPGAAELLNAYAAMDAKSRGHVLAVARALAVDPDDRRNSTQD